MSMNVPESDELSVDNEALVEAGKGAFKRLFANTLPLPQTWPLYARYIFSTLFGGVISRERISMRDKRLLILGAILGSGADASLFEIHTRAALKNGELHKADLEEICLILVNYCGHLRMSSIVPICNKLLCENLEEGI